MRVSRGASAALNAGGGLLLVGGLASIVVGVIDVVNRGQADSEFHDSSGVTTADVALFTSGAMNMLTGAMVIVVAKAFEVPDENVSSNGRSVVLRF